MRSENIHARSYQRLGEHSGTTDDKYVPDEHIPALMRVEEITGGSIWIHAHSRSRMRSGRGDSLVEHIERELK